MIEVVHVHRPTHTHTHARAYAHIRHIMFSSPGGGGAGDRPSAKPTVVNWFSSLRRQPKPKKSTISKALQKSCVDLSQPAIVNTGTQPSAAVDNSEPGSSVIEHTSNVWTNNLSKTLPDDSGSTISRTETVQIDRQKRVNTDVATTTTKVIQTTIITKKSHRVGLVFNDDGELMSKVDAFRNFTNALNNSPMGGNHLVAAGHRRNVNNNNSTSDSDSCRSSSFGGSSNQLDGEFEYIDSDQMKSPVSDGRGVISLAVGLFLGAII